MWTEILIETIVVGSDGSDTAAVAVRNAAELAKSLGARLHVVSATARCRASGSPVRTPTPNAPAGP